MTRNSQKGGSRVGNRRPLLLMGTLVLLLVCGALLWLSLACFNPLTGEYAYDPQRVAPSAFLVDSRPDMRLANELDREVKAGSPLMRGVVNYTITRAAVSIYTDWQPMANLTVDFQYENDRVETRRYRFHSRGARGLPIPFFDISYGADYGPLAGCAEAAPGVFYCQLAP